MEVCNWRTTALTIDRNSAGRTCRFAGLVRCKPLMMTSVSRCCRSLRSLGVSWRTRSRIRAKALGSARNNSPAILRILRFLGAAHQGSRPCRMKCPRIAACRAGPSSTRLTLSVDGRPSRTACKAVRSAAMMRGASWSISSSGRSVPMSSSSRSMTRCTSSGTNSDRTLSSASGRTRSPSILIRSESMRYWAASSSSN